MKKILSVVLALTMVLAMGVTAFAGAVEGWVPGTLGYAMAYTIEGDEVVTVEVVGANVADIDTVTDSANALVIAPKADWTEVGGNVYFTIAAKNADVADLTVLTVKFDNKDTVKYYVEIEREEAPVVFLVTLDELLAETDPRLSLDTYSSTAYVVVNDNEEGITAGVYNYLKALNADKIVFVCADDSEVAEYNWTLYRGDYTKMNVTRNIFFGVDVYGRFLDEYTDDADDANALENAVLKALGNDKAEPFYFSLMGTASYNALAMDDDKVTDLFSVASKPVLTVKVLKNSTAWNEWNNKANVDVYSFSEDTNTVKSLHKNLAVAPATRNLVITNVDSVNGGLYFIVDAATAVNPVKPSTDKDNVGTGANNATAAVIAMIVLAGAAVASKKIAK